MPATTASASAARPWVISQRGLSGSHSRMKNTIERQQRADQERGAPAVLRIDHGGIEQHDGAERAERSADPERAVDDEIGPAAHARRDQFLDGRVDRRVFAADPRPGDEAENQEAPEIPRERGRGGGQQIDGQRDEEQFLAPEPVGEPAEEQRAQHRAGEIGAAREPHIGVAEAQHRARLQGARDRAGERDLEPVENPGDAERRHDQRVETAPRQPVEPRRNVGLDNPAVAGKVCGCSAFMRNPERRSTVICSPR